MCAVDAVPLFSIIFYVIAGAEAPSFTPKVQGTTVCDASNTLNWIVVGVCLFHNALCITPAIVKLFTGTGAICR